MKEALNSKNSKAPEIIKSIWDVLVDHLTNEHNFTNDEAESVSTCVVNHLVNDWRGQIIYFPKFAQLKNTPRDIAIYQQFNGSNQSDLAKKYNLSVPRIYRIIEQVRKDEVARRQTTIIFDVEDDEDDVENDEPEK